MKTTAKKNVIREAKSYLFQLVDKTTGEMYTTGSENYSELFNVKKYGWIFRYDTLRKAENAVKKMLKTWKEGHPDHEYSLTIVLG
jgi:hypothetical protein